MLLYLVCWASLSVYRAFRWFCLNIIFSRENELFFLRLIYHMHNWYNTFVYINHYHYEDIHEICYNIINLRQPILILLQVYQHLMCICLRKPPTPNTFLHERLLGPHCISRLCGLRNRIQAFLPYHLQITNIRVILYYINEKLLQTSQWYGHIFC